MPELTPNQIKLVVKKKKKKTSFSDRFLSFSRIFCHFLPHFPSRQTIPVLFSAASPHFSQRFQSFERKRYWARTVLQTLFRV
ncbi:hypothetical protein P8452_55486 [Trifolium repens]|nr:hypothetical protein P8452_55486 [Trifolium repens]